MLNIPCIIFAGGKSSRMREDKTLLPFGKFPTLTQYQLNKLQKIFKDVYISCKDSSKFNFDAKFILDSNTQNLYAPTLGFISIFKNLAVEKVFVLSVDTPFINKNTIMKIIEEDKNEFQVTVASLNSKIQPLCGIYHASMKDKFQDMLKNNKHTLSFLLENTHTKYVNFTQENIFLNLNEPHEYKKALTLV